MNPIDLQHIRRSIIERFSTAGLMGGFNSPTRVLSRIRRRVREVNTVCMMIVDADELARGVDPRRLLW